MKITALETVRLDEFPNVLWARVHTDEGLTGLGETFFGARAVEASPRDLDRALEPFRRIRAAVGDRMEVMVELHSLWRHPAAVRIAAALEPFDPFWYEDPVRMDSLAALTDYASSRHYRDRTV